MTSIQKNVQPAEATGDDKRYEQIASCKTVKTTTSHRYIYPQLFFCLETVWKDNTKKVITASTMPSLSIKESKHLQFNFLYQNLSNSPVVPELSFRYNPNPSSPFVINNITLISALTLVSDFYHLTVVENPLL